MIAARHAVQRPPDAKLLAIDADGELHHHARADLADLLEAGDLLVANDAATLPASLHGVHVPTGREIEVRLAQRRTLHPRDVHEFTALVFGRGDFRTRTEERELPPPLRIGDVLTLGPLSARVERIVAAPRLVAIRFAGTAASIWAGLARHGRPIQYAHLEEALAPWDVWTPIAAVPAAFEPPSAGFALDWQSLERLRARGVAFATLTHAAGISSTGDAALDASLPFDEPYCIPVSTAHAVRTARVRGGRVVAVGTTVVRALESAALGDGCVRPGEALATQRIGPRTRLQVADAILTGTHEPGTSHFELLRAFARDATLRRATRELDRFGYRTHEFGDFVFLQKECEFVHLEAEGFSRAPRLSKPV
ncbi:MAG TPA: S-adenosylmethionine:tRNA ribosyltransferase-isomerase [Usitatibacter sp.]|nr:S-adenosylmethionine:tRNA ribosyltransferase-isomerase [Usitatibacter sp.]